MEQLTQCSLGLYGHRKRVCTGSCLWGKKKKRKKKSFAVPGIPNRVSIAPGISIRRFLPAAEPFRPVAKADHLAVTQCIFPLKAITYRSCRCAEMQCIFHLLTQLLFRRYVCISEQYLSFMNCVVRKCFVSQALCNCLVVLCFQNVFCPSEPHERV